MESRINALVANNHELINAKIISDAELESVKRHLQLDNLRRLD